MRYILQGPIFVCTVIDCYHSIIISVYNLHCVVYLSKYSIRNKIFAIAIVINGLAIILCHVILTQSKLAKEYKCLF